jgi:hypothetical protein
MILGIVCCGRAIWQANSAFMSMTPTRMRECLGVLGWPLRELARRLRCDDGTIRQMGSGKRPVNDNLGAWLEMLSALHAALSPELREIARQLECDRGKFVRRPRGIRPLTDEEAALLETLATIHAAVPVPVGWEAGRLGAPGPHSTN